MPTKNPQEPYHRATVAEGKQLIDEGAYVIDVREPHEYQEGHVAGATLIPVNSVFDRREELPRDSKILFVCSVGARSALACEMAAAAGLGPDVLYNLEGGTDAWREAGQPIEQ